MKRWLAGAALALLQCGHEAPPPYLPAPPPVAVAVAEKKVCVTTDGDDTWLRCLDEPAQRTGAIAHLSKSLDTAMGLKRRGDAQGRIAIDALLVPLVRAAVSDPTDAVLIGTLFDTEDVRALPAAAAVLDAYPRTHDSDTTSRALSFVVARSREAPFDEPTATSLWSAFLRHHPPATADKQLTAEFYGAIISVKHPTWAPKAVDELHRPTRSNMPAADIEVDVWQRTAVELLGILHFAPAVHLLVATVMNKNLPSLQGVAERALIRMPREVVPMVVTAIASPDSTFVEVETPWGQNHGYVGPLLYTLMFVGSDTAKEALLGLVPKMSSAENRAAMAMALLWMPWDAHVFQVVKDLYNALPPLEGEEGGPASSRLQVLRTIGNSEDPSVVPWVIAEAAKGKGEAGVAALTAAIDRSIPLMQTDQLALVAKTLLGFEARAAGSGDVDKTEALRLRTEFDAASAVVRKCAKDAKCYLGALDEATPVTTDASRWKAVKSAAMCGLVGNDATREALLLRLPKVTDAQARYYLTLAVDHLAPGGDAHAADVFDDLVLREKPRATDDQKASHTLLEEVAYRLRARLAVH